MGTFEVPLCRKGCGHRHYNFFTCEESAHARKGPEYERPPSNPEGFHEWGDQLDSVVNVGGTLWQNQRHDFRVGRPIHSPDESEVT